MEPEESEQSELCRKSEIVWQSLKVILELEPLTVYHLRLNQIMTANNKILTVILDCLGLAWHESISAAAVRNNISITQVRKRLIKALGKRATQAFQTWLYMHPTLLNALIERLGETTWPCAGIKSKTLGSPN